MANIFAIAGACEAVVRLLRWRYDPSQLGGGLQFRVYCAEDFKTPMDEGVSLFVYRLYHDATQRGVPGRLLSGGARRRSELALEVHFLLTAWAKSASREHEIAGWMARVLEDNATLPASLLNDYRDGVFHGDETIETAPAQLSVEDMFEIWEVMTTEHRYRLSIPYVARGVRIESSLLEPVGVPVQERRGEFGSLDAGGAAPAAGVGVAT